MVVGCENVKFNLKSDELCISGDTNASFFFGNQMDQLNLLDQVSIKQQLRVEWETEIRHLERSGQLN